MTEDQRTTLIVKQ